MHQVTRVHYSVSLVARTKWHVYITACHCLYTSSDTCTLQRVTRCMHQVTRVHYSVSLVALVKWQVTCYCMMSLAAFKLIRQNYSEGGWLYPFNAALVTVIQIATILNRSRASRGWPLNLANAEPKLTPTSCIGDRPKHAFDHQRSGLVWPR